MYKRQAPDGHSLGGPFYYIERGMGEKWKWLGKVFAFFGVCVGLFGIGTFSQVNGISSAVQNFFDPEKANCVNIPFLGEYSWAVVISSLILAFCVAAILIGGIQRIATVSQDVYKRQVVGGVISSQGTNFFTSGVVIFAAVLLHNGMGYLLGYGAGKLAGMNTAKKRTISIEVGMQNAGLATNLATTTAQFASAPESAIICAVSCVWHSISGTLIAGFFASLDRKNEKAEDKKDAFPVRN